MKPKSLPRALVPLWGRVSRVQHSMRLLDFDSVHVVGQNVQSPALDETLGFDSVHVVGWLSGLTQVLD